MKNSLLFRVIIVLLAMPMLSFCQSQILTDTEQLTKAHNDLYFTRLYVKDLKDSIIERNLKNTYKAISATKTDKNDLIIAKYFTEYFYLKSYLAWRKNNDNLSLTYIDSSKIFANKTQKYFFDSFQKNKEVNLNCFIDSCSINALTSSIAITKSNILRRMMEKLYESGKSTGFNIQQMETIIKQAEEEDIMKTIFHFAQARTLLKQDKCGLAIQNFNILDYKNKLVGLNVTEKEIYDITDNQIHSYSKYQKYTLQQSDLEEICTDENTIPNKYFISEYPEEQDFQILQMDLLKSCPNFKDTTVYVIGAQAITKGPEPSIEKIKELKEIPFTKQIVELPTGYFKTFSDNTLQSINSVFVKSLSEGGYETDRLGYFSYKDGFALITKLEMISDDGKPFGNPQRFSLEKGEKKYSWKEMLKTLFMGNKGYYRFIIFVVSGNTIEMNKQKILTYNEAIQTISEGKKKLPKEISMKKIPANCVAKAFIYVFEKSEVASSPIMIDLHTSGINQLKNTNLSNLLTK
jgi:hypothetical protein